MEETANITQEENKENGQQDADFTLPKAEIKQSDKPKLEVKKFTDANKAREHVFSINDLLEEKVVVEEWDMEILLVGLTATQRNAVLMAAAKSDGTPDLNKLYPDMVIKSARHPDSREPLFYPADRDALNQRSGKVLDELTTVISRLSGLGKNAEEQAEKN